MDGQVFTETLDWLAFTVPQATVEELSPVVGGEWFEGPTGFRGYPTCWLSNHSRHGVGKLGTGAPRKAKEVHVDLSGGDRLHLGRIENPQRPDLDLCPRGSRDPDGYGPG